METPNVKQAAKFKTIMLGASFVGKTSITDRFVRDSFRDDMCHGGPGAAFFSKRAEIDGSPVLYEIWDTAGQERYRSLAPMYYRNAHGVVLAYDVTERKSFEEDVPSWLNDLRSQKEITADIPIILMGNKIDLNQKRVVSIEEGERFASESNLLFMETSALTGAGVKEAFEALGRNMLERYDYDAAYRKATDAAVRTNSKDSSSTQWGCAC